MPGINASGTVSASKTHQAWGITKLTVFLAIAVFSTSVYANLPHWLGLERLYRFVPPFDGRDLSMVDHLGGEHRSIAEALIGGRGFADPFHEQTGPTAWMPPVLPIIQAVLMTLGGINLAVIAIVFLQNLSLVFSGWIVIRTAARCNWPRAPVISLAPFLMSTWSYFSSCYQYTHDSWLILCRLECSCTWPTVFGTCARATIGDLLGVDRWHRRSLRASTRAGVVSGLWRYWRVLHSKSGHSWFLSSSPRPSLCRGSSATRLCSDGLYR